MTSVAVLAHTGKSLGGGLEELRRVLQHEGVDAPLWFEVPKSRKAPKCARAAVDAGADLVLVWGGDGMVQRCIDALAGVDAVIAIVPAGTANLLATNLGIPRDIEEAVRIALHGRRHRLDVGQFNGERFAVMAGAGWDALMIKDADGTLKDRLGRVAYVWTGARHLTQARFRAVIKVDGSRWFAGKASCVLVGNVGKVFGGIEVFEHARPDDGRLELGVITAKGPLEWTRALARIGTGTADASPFVSTTTARKIRMKFDRPVRYELDGGDRDTVRRIRVEVVPGAVTVCVPNDLEVVA
jgi:YegS/Rv2252/BmrU family lipid kinase